MFSKGDKSREGVCLRNTYLKSFRETNKKLVQMSVGMSVTKTVLKVQISFHLKINVEHSTG